MQRKCLKCDYNITHCNRSENYSLLPRLEVTSFPTNTPHLTHSDVDLHMPYDINFNYYNSHEFHDNPDIAHCLEGNSSFSVLNCNIRSLSANFDTFNNMLKDMYFKFSIIGLTEIKLKINQDPITKCDLLGYNYIPQPSFSNAGGVGFFIKKNLKYTQMADLTITEQDYESFWVELLGEGRQNILCGVVYRHPHGNLDNFQEYINSTLDMIQRQNKLCIIMGDLNLDLLKYETHNATDEFINTLGTSFFQPHILQPTRITDHTATLIDNIFFNSMDYFTLSGNLVYDVTDHLPNFLIINKFSSLNTKIKIFRRD